MEQRKITQCLFCKFVVLCEPVDPSKDTASSLRHIRSEESEKLAAFEEIPLVELIVERGPEALDLLPAGLRASPEAMAETIENNVRRLIIDEMAVNPAYY